MPQPENRPKVTVEDLLRLKRAERPTAEFWSSFEYELRQKQLTALLKQRSWWQELPQLLARHAYLPVGATAIFAFTLVSVKYFPSSQVSPVAAVPVSVGAGPLAATEKIAPAPVSSVLINREADSALSAPENSAAPTATAVASADVMPVMVAPAPAESPSARSIAANLAKLEQTEPELVNSVLGSRLSPPSRELASEAPVTELASISVGSAKRNRLLVSYTDRPMSPEPTAPTVVRERLSRQLADPEIYDRLSRVGVKGDAVSLGLTLRL